MIERRKHIVDVIFVLALVCVFAVSALGVVILGTDIYKKTAASMEENYGLRTSLLYLAEKVRQNDHQGGIRLDSVEGRDALVLPVEIDGERYETWIFAINGNLREVMMLEGTSAQPNDGQAIMELEALDLTFEDGLLTIEVTDPGGGTSSILLSPRC